jgi:hypothetical protein
MIKNHQWREISGRKRIEKRTGGRVTHRVRVYDLKNIKECVNCGLRKGEYSNASGGWRIAWHSLIYFKDNKYLSEMKLPYACGGKPENFDNFEFLSEDDFNV